MLLDGFYINRHVFANLEKSRFKKNSRLDNKAWNRLTTIYVLTKIHFLIPGKLSRAIFGSRAQLLHDLFAWYSKCTWRCRVRRRIFWSPHFKTAKRWRVVSKFEPATFLDHRAATQHSKIVFCAKLSSIISKRTLCCKHCGSSFGCE